MPGDLVGNLEGYVNAGLIAGEGVPGPTNLTVDLTRNPGFTTVYVTVIPEPSAMVLIGLGASILATRRR